MGVLKVKQADGSWKKVGCGTVVTPLTTVTDSTAASGSVLRRADVGSYWQRGTVTASIDNTSTGRIVLEFQGPSSGTSLSTGIVCELNLGFTQAQLNIRRNGTIIATMNLGARTLFNAPPFTITGEYDPTAATATVSLTGHALANTLTATGVAAVTSSNYVLFGQTGAITQSFTSATLEGLAAEPGRLKLWDGSQWVRERCDDDVVSGHPLKMWDGSSWVTVACMVPA